MHHGQLPPDQIIPGEYGACVKDSSGCVVYANCSNKYHETSYNTDAYLAERAYFNVTWMKVYTKSPGPPTPCRTTTARGSCGPRASLR